MELSKGKVSKTEMNLECSKNIKKASMAGVSWVQAQ